MILKNACRRAYELVIQILVKRGESAAPSPLPCVWKGSQYDCMILAPHCERR